MYVFSCVVKLKIFEVFGQQSNITIYLLFYLLKFLILRINYTIHRNILICWKFYKLIELCYSQRWGSREPLISHQKKKRTFDLS